MSAQNSAVIVDAVRTPLGKGKPGGAYSAIHPVDLHSTTLAALVERTGIDPVVVDDVISGAPTTPSPRGCPVDESRSRRRRR